MKRVFNVMRDQSVRERFHKFVVDHCIGAIQLKGATILPSREAQCRCRSLYKSKSHNTCQLDRLIYFQAMKDNIFYTFPGYTERRAEEFTPKFRCIKCFAYCPRCLFGPVVRELEKCVDEFRD